MRLLLVVNEAASSVTARARVIIQHRLGGDHDLTVAGTSRRGHATRLAQGAAADGIDVVVVLGGDGTLNEAANGLAGTPTALGVLPGGSTNVFARTIGMVNDPLPATGQLLEALAGSPAGPPEPPGTAADHAPGTAADDTSGTGTGEAASGGGIRPVALGNVNGRYFLFHVGLGFDAAVVAEVERRSVLKRWFGAAAFAGATVVAWRHRDRRPFAVRVADDPPLESLFAVVLRSSPYTYVGRTAVDLAPGTGFEGGLSVVAFEHLSVGSVAATVLASGRRSPSAGVPSVGVPSAGGRAGGADESVGGRWWPGTRSVALRRDVHEVWVGSDRPIPYQVDGDYLGSAREFTIRSVPDALRLVVPARTGRS